MCNGNKNSVLKVNVKDWLILMRAKSSCASLSRIVNVSNEGKGVLMMARMFRHCEHVSNCLLALHFHLI